MKRGKPVILLLTVLFVAVAVVFGRSEISMQNFPFSVMIISDGRQEELHCMKIAGEYYMFLPSYAQRENAQICTNSMYDVFIDGQQLTENHPCTDFPINTKLGLFYRSLNDEGYETVTFVQSANVATMYIDVPSGSMAFIHEEKGNAEGAEVRLYTEDGQLDYSGWAESIKGRGNSTWWPDKKPYSVKLQKDADLLGMGQAQKWILLANAYDDSNLRNKLVYDFAKEVGMEYAPDSTLVDLYLNGEYAGMYLLCERNEVHEQRVALQGDDQLLVSKDILERFEDQGYPYVSTASGASFRIHYTTMENEEMTDIFQSVENAILATDGIDPATGKYLTELIDMDSWVKKYLIEEIFGNGDACSVSQYFYYKADLTSQKLYAGPVWDYDYALGTEFLTGMPNVFFANRPHIWAENDGLWFAALYENDIFHRKMVEVYQSTYLPLLTELLECKIDQYAANIQQASRMNGIRWAMDNMEEDLAYIKNYMNERVSFLSSVWLEKKEYCIVQADTNYTFEHYAVLPGTSLADLFQDRAFKYTWNDASTNEPFDVTQPIYEDCSIRLISDESTS